MLRNWEDSLIGNNPGTVSSLPRTANPARVLINLVRGRRVRRGPLLELPSAA